MTKIINLLFLHPLIVGALPLNGDQHVHNKSRAQYRLETTIPWAPVNATSVDQSVIYNGKYYLSDRNNLGVNVVDLATDTQITVVTGFAGVGPGTAHAFSGPNGLQVLPKLNELFAGDTNGTVRVIDLATNTIVANIFTGSQTRADEMSCDTETNTVVVTNPSEVPPFVSVIDGATRQVTGHVIFNNASGLEQPTFNTLNKRFYVSVPSSTEFPGGAVAELDQSHTAIARFIDLQSCNPAGIVFGHAYDLFVGCSVDQILNFNLAYSLIIDVRTGTVLGNITGFSGIDQVTFNANTNLFYASAYQNQAGGLATGAPTPQLGIIDAGTKKLVQIIPTDNVTAHSVAVDPETNQFVVPIEKAGMEVYDVPRCY